MRCLSNYDMKIAKITPTPCFCPWNVANAAQIADFPPMPQQEENLSYCFRIVIFSASLFFPGALCPLGAKKDTPAKAAGASFCSVLLDFQASGSGLRGNQLGHCQCQDAVVKAGLDGLGVHAIQIEAAGETAIGALAAEIIPLLVLLLVVGVTLGTDGQGVVRDINVDIFLLEAGQVGLEHVLRVILADVSAEGACALVAEKFPFHPLHHAEGIVITGERVVVSKVRNQRHDQNLLSY